MKFRLAIIGLLLCGVLGAQVLTPTQLKNKFLNGMKPTQTDFASLIDASYNQLSTTLFSAGGTGGVITLSPYATSTSGGFYSGTTNPSGTTRLNYGGYLYATQLYSGGLPVVTSLVQRWDSLAGNIYRLNGNVGIGTSTPAYKLHVLGTAYVNGLLTLSDSVRLGYNAGLYNLSNQLYLYDGTAGLVSLNTLKSSGGGTNYFLKTGNDIYPINTSDNLAVGTTTAGGYKLSVSGNVNITGSFSGNLVKVPYASGVSIGDKTGAANSLKNVFIGYYSGNTITSGNNNTAVGTTSGNLLTTGSLNTYVGVNSGGTNPTGNNNVMIGANSGLFSTQGNNTFLGYGTGLNNTGSGNVYIGYSAGYNSTGSNELYITNSNTTSPLIYGVFDSYLKFNADSVVSTGYYRLSNTVSKLYFGNGGNYIGQSALNDMKINNAGLDYARFVNTGGKNKIYLAGDSIFWNGLPFGPSVLIGTTNSTSPWNVFLGYQAGASATTGYSNTFIGTRAGFSNTTGYNNVFLGDSAGLSNTTGYHNMFSGAFAGRSNTTGIRNSFLGFYSGLSNVSGNNNTFIGFASGVNNTASENIFIGTNAGYSNTSGTANLFLGFYSGNANISGINNTFMGYQSAHSNTTGSYNTYLGYYSGFDNNGSNNVFIGNQSGRYETGSNKLYISNSSTSNPLIKGDFSTPSVQINGALVMGQTYGAGMDTLICNAGVDTMRTKNVSGISWLKLTGTSGGIIGLRGLTGGVAGQILYIVKGSFNLTLYLAGLGVGGMQQFYIPGYNNNSIAFGYSAGGFTVMQLFFDGTYWYIVHPGGV